MALLTIKCDDFGLNQGLHNLQRSGELVDVTLACQGEYIRAHKNVLASCSPYFTTLFQINAWQQTIVFMQDAELSQLQALVDFMYNGEVTMVDTNLPGFLKLADALKVKGLDTQRENAQATEHVPSNHTASSSSPPPAKISRSSHNRDPSPVDNAAPPTNVEITPQQEQQQINMSLEQSSEAQIDANCQILLSPDVKQEAKNLQQFIEDPNAVSMEGTDAEEGQEAEAPQEDK